MENDEGKIRWKKNRMKEVIKYSYDFKANDCCSGEERDLARDKSRM